jgi:predicted GNAT family acetyltransferase
VLAGARINEASRDPGAWGELWGFGDPGALRSICWFGGTMIPVGVAEDDLAGLAERAKSKWRGCASIVGQAEQVLGLWEMLEGHWPPARVVRRDQPLLLATSPGPLAPDPFVRRASSDDFADVLPAAVAMFTEELGFSPLRDGPGYRWRVSDLLTRGMTYVRTNTHAGLIGGSQGGTRVVFKADLGAVIGHGAQLHGVWVRPDMRGQHLARHGVASVLADALTRGFTSVSLYVNSFNAPALAAYEAVGFQQIGTWATVMM